MVRPRLPLRCQLCWSGAGRAVGLALSLRVWCQPCRGFNAARAGCSVPAQLCSRPCPGFSLAPPRVRCRTRRCSGQLRKFCCSAGSAGVSSSAPRRLPRPSPCCRSVSPRSLSPAQVGRGHGWRSASSAAPEQPAGAGLERFLGGDGALPGHYRVRCGSAGSSGCFLPWPVCPQELFPSPAPPEEALPALAPHPEG